MQVESGYLAFVKRALGVSIEHLGIQRSATDILFILYIEKHETQSALSIRDIVRKSGLSLSSVSVLCSRLEALGILNRRSDDSSSGRGRRRILYELSMSIDELMTLGISKYIQEVGRICRDIKNFQRQNSPDGETKELLDRLENEICSFLSEHRRIVSDASSLWFDDESKDEIDLKEKIVESVF
ncbi:MAG: MarR family transcriptional regulator [Candidatus Thorarchaeota archaeon]